MRVKFIFYLFLSLFPFALSSQCTMANYLAAVRIPIASYPYVATSAPTLTVSAATFGGVPTLGNSSYLCGPDLYAGASPAWWLNGATQTITITFSSPVTNLTYLINGTNATEEFYIVSNGTCAISLSNFCTVGFTSVGGTLTAGPTAGLGSIITVSNPGGATVYSMTHNGLGAGSRVTLLDCFVKGSGACALPIELSDFKADCSGKNTVELNWKTGSEKGNDYFTIERSRDADSWQAIGIVDGAGSSNSIHKYFFTDEKPLRGIVYYRLKQTDFNKFNVNSDIVSVDNCSETNTDDVIIYPNPSSQQFTVSGNDIESLQLFNMFGTELLNKKILSPDDLKINAANYPIGVYFLKIGNKNYKIVKED